ncbi:hypothetical protein HHK36_013193 [Tetracentron sinense]|uniref:Uncharacterized protein n=1 Tax=Tetracentron sinense TaxID=13715 RepID=A0A835DGD3_TETSI|nr:hypothetical protein HHK36_013193 [Tetracentron sinense]
MVYCFNKRIYKLSGSGRCDDNSTAPPCTGWVEMMAPVFSRETWRYTWHMTQGCTVISLYSNFLWFLLQNDLIHAWGLDKQLGYCDQATHLSLNLFNFYFDNFLLLQHLLVTLADA